LGIFIDFNPLFTPDIPTNIVSRNLQIYLSLQDIGIGTHILAQTTNITPVALRSDIAIERISLP
jgi:hypothetical protein